MPLKQAVNDGFPFLVFVAIVCGYSKLYERHSESNATRYVFKRFRFEGTQIGKYIA